MNHFPGTRSAGCLVAAALLWAAPAAHAVVKVDMGPAGLSVVPQEAAKAEDLQIIGRLTPEGVIANWDVESTGCISLGFTCVESDDTVDCDDQRPFSFRASCIRRVAGVHVQLRGGDDNLDVYRAKGDAFTFDMGGGDDTLDTDGFEINAGEPPGGGTGPWNATLGDGDDAYQGSLGADTVDAGDGGDRVTTLAGDDFVQGGAGNDVITPGAGSDGVSAGSGNDTVVEGLDADHATDSYDGGPGFDTLSYFLRANGIFVAAIGTTGGASGENDGIAGFERIVGGGGNDSILGFSSNGGPGNDVLTGSSGDDTITGGTGADTMRGFAGNDTIDANDGIADTRIDCSTGKDEVFLDLKDPVPVDAVDCESIDRRKVDEEPGTRILTSRARVRGRHVKVRLRCPRADHRRCAGRLTLRLRGKRTTRYRIRAGRARAVRLALTAAGASRVTHASHPVTGVVTSREHGRKGDETVIRRIPLR